MREPVYLQEAGVPLLLKIQVEFDCLQCRLYMRYDQIMVSNGQIPYPPLIVRHLYLQRIRLKSVYKCGLKYRHKYMNTTKNTNAITDTDTNSNQNTETKYKYD